MMEKPDAFIEEGRACGKGVALSIEPCGGMMVEWVYQVCYKTYISTGKIGICNLLVWPCFVGLFYCTLLSEIERRWFPCRFGCCQQMNGHKKGRDVSEMYMLKRMIWKWKNDPVYMLSRTIDTVGLFFERTFEFFEPFATAVAEASDEQERILQFKAENPDLQIGQVRIAGSLLDESEVNDYLRSFAYSCVRRGRGYDWCDASDEQKEANERAILTDDPIEYYGEIPDICCLGEGYPERIKVCIDRRNNETVVSFEGEEE